MTRTRLLLVDDHAILRETLKMLLRTHPDLDVVGEAKDANEALTQTQHLQPDIICLDLSLPGGGGRLLTQLLERSPRSRVLVLTMHSDPATLRAMMGLGATGYIVKSSSPSILLAGIRAVAVGNTYVDPSLKNEAPPPPVRGGSPAKLSEREREVLRLLAQGFSHARIAELLFLSTKTVETYRTRLGHKLHLRDRADLVQYARAAGLLDELGETPGAASSQVSPPTAKDESADDS
ncbi:MAG: response regulator transcription factor [Gemmataceae bacterium]